MAAKQESCSGRDRAARRSPCAYILHPGVSLHDVFLHLVGIFLQALDELSQLLAGDAGDKEGDSSPHKHGHSPRLLPGAALGVL